METTETFERVYINGDEKNLPREIMLSNGMIVLVDADDYERLIQYKWFYYYRGYAAANVNGKWTYMHRFILGISDKTKITDHINHIKLDNRKCNLRVCDQSENKKNRKGYGKIKYVGVTESPRLSCMKYRASITSNGKRIDLGAHNTPEEAARAYDRAAKQYNGQFANLNFKDDE